MELSDEKIYLVETNTDLTEGRGTRYPIYHCKTRSTAERLSKNKGVMGTNAIVSEVSLFEHDGKKYINIWNVHLINPSSEDLLKEEKHQQALRLAEEKSRAIQRAKELGLSDEDIEALKR